MGCGLHPLALAVQIFSREFSNLVVRGEIAPFALKPCPLTQVIRNTEGLGSVSYTHLTLPTKRIV